MLKQQKPTTPGLRHKIVLIKKTDSFNKKKLTFIIKKTGGRNNTGRITTRHIGGGHKRRVRLIDYTGNIGAYAKSTLISSVYDPFHTGVVSLYETPNGKNFLRLSCNKISANEEILGKHCNVKNNTINGAISALKNIPVGTKVFNIQTSRLNKTQIAKAAGTFGIIIKQEEGLTTIKLPSKKIKSLNNNFVCTIGSNGNEDSNKLILGKAGISRWLGIKPTVRGEAMNPIDHPHGGKTSGGGRLKTVYGKLAKFIKTKK